MITRTSIHALLAVSALAELPEGRFAGAGEVAQSIGAPRNYLGKLLKSLTDHGILLSQKGKGGGFRLARPPGEIRLLDVVDPIEHVSRWSACFLGRQKCSDRAPCAVHEQWKTVREAYLGFLERTTITDLTVKTGSGESSGSGPATCAPRGSRTDVKVEDRGGSQEG